MAYYQYIKPITYGYILILFLSNLILATDITQQTMGQPFELPKTSLFVHMSNALPLVPKLGGGGIHFSWNRPVLAHAAGDWTSKKIAVLIPSSYFQGKMPLNISEHDVCYPGPLSLDDSLPKGTIIVLHTDLQNAPQFPQNIKVFRKDDVHSYVKAVMSFAAVAGHDPFYSSYFPQNSVMENALNVIARGARYPREFWAELLQLPQAVLPLGSSIVNNPVDWMRDAIDAFSESAQKVVIKATTTEFLNVLRALGNFSYEKLGERIGEDQSVSNLWWQRCKGKLDFTPVQVRNAEKEASGKFIHLPRKNRGVVPNSLQAVTEAVKYLSPVLQHLSGLSEGELCNFFNGAQIPETHCAYLAVSYKVIKFYRMMTQLISMQRANQVDNAQLVPYLCGTWPVLSKQQLWDGLLEESQAVAGLLDQSIAQKMLVLTQYYLTQLEGQLFLENGDGSPDLMDTYVRNTPELTALKVFLKANPAVRYMLGISESSLLD